LESLVTKTVHAEGGIVDIRVVERLTVFAKKGSRDIGKSGASTAGSLSPQTTRSARRSNVTCVL
jgi:hypothetical protein